MANAKAHAAKWKGAKPSILVKAVQQHLCTHPLGPTFFMHMLVNNRIRVRCDLCGASVVVKLE